MIEVSGRWEGAWSSEMVLGPFTDILRQFYIDKEIRHTLLLLLCFAAKIEGIFVKRKNGAESVTGERVTTVYYVVNSVVRRKKSRACEHDFGCFFCTQVHTKD